MSLHRRNPKRDNNEAAIVQALEAAGFFVQRMSATGMPDLYVYRHGESHFVEVKSKTGKLTKAQQQWRGPLVIVLRSVDEALGFAKVVR